MVDKRVIADPKSSYGSGKAATRAFRWQRLTGALNIFFLGFLIWLVVSQADVDRAAMVATVSHPLVALVLAALLVIVPIHMRIGMREIIEDYVHDARLGRLAMTVNDVFALLVALAALASIIKIVFWG